MINLLAVSYHNIGPFKDQLLTIFFDEGKYLIKAPIGAGKSFLFFDGPIYGLYKYSGRSILNAQCKSGFVKLLFEVDGQTYLIVRNLTKGKSKESCATTLHVVTSVEGLVSSPGISQGDIEQTLKEQKVKMEEVSFKNETDLQQTLQNILPPREVFLNTVFLMQDSDNIFELQPADRLTVLKNVFNLIGIDEAKEKIADRKKEIWYKLKATADTSKYDEKLKKLLADYMGTYKNIADCKLQIADVGRSFFDELENIYEKVNIADFSADDFPVKMHEEIDSKVEAEKAEYQKINHQLQTLVESHKVENRKVEEYQKEVKDLQSKIQNGVSKISEIDPSKIEKLKEEKKALQEQELILGNSIKSEEIKKFYAAHAGIFDDFKVASDAVSNAYLFVQYLKNQGKILQEEIKNIQLQIKNEELKDKAEKEKVEQEIATLKEKIKEYIQQGNILTEKIALFDKDMDQQATFGCSKIGTNCPYIKVINKKTFDQLEKQKALLIEEQMEMNMKIKDSQEALLKKETMQGEHKTANGEPLLGDFSARNAKLEKLIDEIKTFLNAIDRKHIETTYDDIQTLLSKIKIIDTHISNSEGETKKLEEYKLDIEKNKIQIEHIQRQIEEANGRLQKAEKEKIEIEKQVQKIDYPSVLELEHLNTKMKEVYRDIHSLVHEFKDVQLQVKLLQQEEEVMNNLYTIFSKELLLLVLQDHLPTLNEVINSYLAQVVEYQITFSLHKNSSDKLELLAQIFDEKGERDVKSLSGGQRVILKIVWMLAISSYIHSPVLFIDETINNLDADTVGKVSDMLEDFVKSRSMKLYAVTHNQQIQEMKFWDKVIEL